MTRYNLLPYLITLILFIVISIFLLTDRTPDKHSSTQIELSGINKKENSNKENPETHNNDQVVSTQDKLKANPTKKEKQKQIDKKPEQISIKKTPSYMEPYGPNEKIPEKFKRENYEDHAEEVLHLLKEKIERFKALEKKNGVVTHARTNGDKHLIDVHNEEGEVIGKIVYNMPNRIHQIVDWKEGQQHGFTAFLTKDEFPYRIFKFKDNKLNGVSMQFERNGKYKGALTQYSEFENHHYCGLSLGWTPKGVPLKICRVYEDPKLFKGLP